MVVLRLAGTLQETLSRIETGKHISSLAPGPSPP